MVDLVEIEAVAVDLVADAVVDSAVAVVVDSVAAVVVVEADLVVVEVVDLGVEEAVAVVVLAVVSAQTRDLFRHMPEQRLPCECIKSVQVAPVPI